MTMGKADTALAREFGGTFVANQRPVKKNGEKSMAVWGSTAYTPEIREEEERVADGKFWYYAHPNDEPAAHEIEIWNEPGRPFNWTLGAVGCKTIEDAVQELLQRNMLHVFTLYKLAKVHGRNDVFEALCAALEERVNWSNRNRVRRSFTAPREGTSLRRVFAGYAKHCPQAQRILTIVGFKANGTSH